MSSSSFADSGSFTAADLSGTLEFRPRPSKLLARFLVIAHVAAALTALYFVPGRLMLALVLGFIAISFLRSYRRHILQLGSRAARRVLCQDDGVWFLQDTLGVTREARLLPSTFLHPRLVILNFELCRSAIRRSLVLCPDSLDVQTLRRLRARLRTSAQIEADPEFNQV